KYKNEFVWLKEVDSLALANAGLQLDVAYKNFFRRKEVGFPRFKAKHHGNKSYTTNLVNGNIKLGTNKIKLPKLQEMKIVIHRDIPDSYQLKSATISQEPSGKYYVSLLFVCENQTCKPTIINTDKIIGIDFAMQGLGVFSDGNRAKYPMYYKKAEKRLKREQRKLSKCLKGSSNYYKQKRKVALAHEKVRHQREDFQHKLSHKLANAMDIVFVEDLNLKEMSRKLNLGKGVMDNGYGSFLTKLTYKLEERGKVLVKVGKYYPSSKTCSVCNKVKDELSISERVFICECGNIMDRDINAAINIRDEGKRLVSA
ncbi:MAG: RNA-guided endonuclease InsQ/TnpB family protein, partial [Suipraeoptans sp.]